MTVPKEKYGVHQTHCCVFHGCKYGHDSDCPVVSGEVIQKYECESCITNEYMSGKQDKRYGLYKHFKGTMYELFELAKDSSTLEEVAVYRDTEGNIWTRPWKEFDDIHPSGAKRFEKI
jgi:hypothetical protein